MQKIAPHRSNFLKLHKKDTGKLPVQPVVNPKGQYIIDEITPPSGLNLEQVQAITTLQNGRVVDNKVDEKAEILALKNSTSSSKNLKDSPEIPNPPIQNIETSYEPKAHFPQCLIKSTHIGKKGDKIQDMFEVFKQVKINIPLLDVIKKIPPYAKFLKDLCTQKHISKSNIPKKVSLTKQASAIIQHNTPPKFKDPVASTISCVTGDNKIEKALLDLGSSVNLIPYSVYLQLGLGELKSTSVVLQLADRYVKQPRGIIEDVLIKVDNFYFPVDFMVLDTKPVHNPIKHIPVIFGRPFLAIANASIYC
ncbi:uncharacterized protein LOC132277788 [Cornus florida]|uniref:uncharacterized protein LOC132277788 n=1 Tax=Cornus florida TaxID=4283 RepID=UPI00289CF66D|nr:uncharacterized protein LOC132277788 [Cornus florida]